MRGLSSDLKQSAAALGVLLLGTVLAARCLSEEGPVRMELVHLQRGLLLWAKAFEEHALPRPQLLSVVPRLAALPARLSAGRLWLEAKRASSSHPLPIEWRDNGMFSATWGREAVQSVLAARKLVLAAWCLTGVLLWFGLQSWGRGPALLVLALWSLSPTMLSFCFRTQSDGPAAIAAVLSCLAFRTYVRRPSLRTAAAAGSILGVALHVKLSMVFLVPVWVVVGLLRWPARPTRALMAALRNTTLGLLIAYAVFWFVAADLPAADTTQAHNKQTVARAVISSLSGWILPTGYAEALNVQLSFLEQRGRAVRVWGTRYPHGTPWYYAGTFVLKEPVGTAAALCLSAVMSIAVAAMRVRVDPLEMLPFWLMAGYVFLAASLGTGYADYRYILPALACGSVVVGWTAAAAPRVVRNALCILVCFGVLETLYWTPFFTSFVSLAGGGPERAYRLVDPLTVCRGQDLGRLVHWLRQHPHAVPLTVLIFDNPLQPDAYGIPSAPLPISEPPEVSGDSNNVPQPSRWVAAEIVFGQEVPLRFWSGARAVHSEGSLPALRTANKVADISPVMAVYKLAPP